MMLKIKKEEKSYLVKHAKELNKGHISLMNIPEVFTVPIPICLFFFFFKAGLRNNNSKKCCNIISRETLLTRS